MNKTLKILWILSFTIMLTACTQNSTWSWTLSETNINAWNNANNNLQVEVKWNTSETQTKANEKQLAFASCLKEKWAKFYWTTWCSHCQNQKSLLWWEDATKALWFIDCDKESNECKNAWIQAYPTWIINWKTLMWVQSIENLWKETWCSM